MFIDRVRIHAKAGNGGNGSASFRREKFIPKGGPDGGDGGNGGNVILQATTHETQLAALFFEPILRAKNGAAGSSRQKSGKYGSNLIIPVPVGTLVYRLPPPDMPSLDSPSEEPSPEEEAPQGKQARRRKKLPPPNPDDLIADLSEVGQEVVICQGGRGGRGNVHFKSSRNRTPRRFTEGTEGEESWFLLEMRSIAFAGLVGYPNAGKSTLLSALSAAHPKVAPYAFTTRHPQVGVVDLSDYQRTTVADIPGLIEGASQNRGLGHEFLRHIMRCRHLLFVLDMAGTEGRDPLKDLQDLRQELELYNPILAKQSWSVVANKMDMPEAEDHLKQFREQYPSIDVIPMCAELGEGVDALKNLLEKKEAEARAEDEALKALSATTEIEEG